MNPYLLLTVYCLLVLLASLAGGWIPLLVRLTHARIQVAISLIAGFMLGVALLHMLPHALLEMPADASITTVVGWMMAGLLVMFFLQRFFAFHHHDAPTLETEAAEAGFQHAETVHDDACDHAHDHRHDQHRLTWGGAFVGLTVHSVIGGVALAASVAAETTAGASYYIAGLAVFLVIFLHKPFDSMTIGTLMAVGRSSYAFRHLVNALYALTIPLGVILFYLGAGWTTIDTAALTCYALAFSAGTFLCISLSDLLPEIQFHHHDRVKLSTALLLGVALAWTISFYESKMHGHDHGQEDGHGHGHAGHVEGDAHAGHEHE